MAGRKENDEISKLLDSFEADGALEEKMEGFAAKKRRQDKYTQQINMIDVDDTQETKTPTANDTIVLRPARLQQAESEAGETVMFDPDQIEEQTELTNKTVVINDDEIQSLLEQEQGPKLRREVKGHSKKPVAKMRKKNDKTVKIVLAVLVSLLVVAVIGTGAYVLLNGIGENAETENDRQAVAYERIMDWLDTVDDDFTGIEDMEEYYNRLSDEQKEEIDDLLKSRTGYTFDELLARAKSDEKKDSSNNNTEIAELRAKLSTLQTQLSSAQSTLDSAKSTLTTRQSEYDALVEQSQNAANAQANLESAQAAVDECEARRQELLNKQSAGTITEEELIELDNIYKVDWPSLNDALEQAQREVNNAPSVSQDQLNSASQAVSQAQSAVDQAQSAVDEINSQISQIQSQINELE